MSLGKKLASALIAVSLLLIGISTFSYIGFNKTTNHFLEISQTDLPKSFALADMRTHAMATVRNAAMLSKPNISDELRKVYMTRLDERVKSFNEASEKFARFERNENESQLLNQILASWQHISSDALKIKELTTQNAAKNETEVMKILTTSLEQEMTSLTKAIRGLDDYTYEHAKASVIKATEVQRRTVFSTIVMVVGGVIGLLIFGLLFTSYINRKVASIVDRIAESAQSVAAKSQEIAAASTELSSITSNQASALQQTTAAAEEISAMVGKNAEGAEQSKRLSITNTEKSDEGKTAASEMLLAMQEISHGTDDISHEVGQSNAQMNEIIHAISEINEKTKIINEIVFQTKLLSFNASVEAARAGEHGKGFAVVAEEIGNLAKMSGNSSREISELLNQSTANINQIIKSSKDNINRVVSLTKEKVNFGIRLANKCEEILVDVSAKSNEVKSSSIEVYTASLEQEKGVKEISSAMNMLDKSNQEIASTAFQSSQVAEELNTQSINLKNYVDELNDFVKGQSEAQPHHNITQLVVRKNDTKKAA